MKIFPRVKTQNLQRMVLYENYCLYSHENCLLDYYKSLGNKIQVDIYSNYDAPTPAQKQKRFK